MGQFGRFFPRFYAGIFSKKQKTRKNKAFERVIILLIILLMELKIWDTPGTRPDKIITKNARKITKSSKKITDSDKKLQNPDAHIRP